MDTDAPWYSRCRWLGHRWARQRPLEHICYEDFCWRCWKKRPVHLSGPYHHTCALRPKESPWPPPTPPLSRPAGVPTAESSE